MTTQRILTNISFFGWIWQKFDQKHRGNLVALSSQTQTKMSFQSLPDACLEAIGSCMVRDGRNGLRSSASLAATCKDGLVVFNFVKNKIYSPFQALPANCLQRIAHFLYPALPHHIIDDKNNVIYSALALSMTCKAGLDIAEIMLERFLPNTSKHNIQKQLDEAQKTLATYKSTPVPHIPKDTPIETLHILCKQFALKTSGSTSALRKKLLRRLRKNYSEVLAQTQNCQTNVNILTQRLQQQLRISSADKLKYLPIMKPCIHIRDAAKITGMTIDVIRQLANTQHDVLFTSGVVHMAINYFGHHIAICKFINTS